MSRNHPLLFLLLSSQLVLTGLNAGVVTTSPEHEDRKIVVAKDESVTFTATPDSGDVTTTLTVDPSGPTISGSGSSQTATFAAGTEGQAYTCTLSVTHTDGDVTCTDGQQFTYTVYVPKIEIKEIDVFDDKLTVDILPGALMKGDNTTTTVKGDSDRIMVDNKPLAGGSDQKVDFNWEKFDQTPGAQYKATKIEVKWKRNKGNVEATGEKDKSFTGYGKFRISKYVTPDDDQWTGPMQNVSFSASGAAPYRSVHSNWITRVKGQEGVGMSQGTIYRIRRTNNGAPVSYFLEETEEGAYVAVLTPNKSLAKHQSENRFASHDPIHLVTDKSVHFAIEDTGIWTDGNNHFDRFGGRVGPSDANVDFASSFVAKVK